MPKKRRLLPALKFLSIEMIKRRRPLIDCRLEVFSCQLNLPTVGDRKPRRVK